MVLFAYVRRITGLLLTAIRKHGIAVSLLFFLPAVFLVIWLAMPHMIHGPNALVWLVTGVLVVICLPLIWFIHRLTSRIDKAIFTGDDLPRTTRIHELARRGALADLEIELRSSGADERRDEQGYTPLMVAVMSPQAGVDVARCLIEHGADVNAVAPQPGLADALKFLTEAGLDTSFLKKANRTPGGNSVLSLAVQHDHPECVQLLIEAGAEIYDEDAFGFDLLDKAASPDVIWILHGAGLALDGLPSQQRVGLLPANDGQPFAVSPADYQSFRDRRFGESNPDEMGNRFWNEMVRTRCSGYEGREKFGEGEHECPSERPVWCFDRNGQSLTRLPSGQFVEIGGEHEDFYDPDFCIYNDVVVHDGQGRFRIFGYPRDVFPPTDFHSATLLDGAIYIIGSLGYLDARHVGETPVFRLNCETWRMESVPSRGSVPGWIHKHKARAEDDGTILIWGGTIWDGQECVDNQQTFRFDPRTGQWDIDAAS